MRYSILGFNQEELIKYDIDMTDVLLMDYIQKALSQPSMIKTVKDEQPYVWLQHSKILEDLPILDIKESMLKKRLAKLVDIGLIEFVNVTNTHGRGSRSYYTITNVFETLQMTECKKLSLVERPSVKNYTPNNKLNTDNNKTISKDIVQSPKKQSLWSKCSIVINEFTDDSKLQELLNQALKQFLENSKESGTPFYTNNFIGKLNALKKLSDNTSVQCKIVQQTLDNGWNGFYALKMEKQKTGDFAKDVEHLYSGLNERATKKGDTSGQKY